MAVIGIGGHTCLHATQSSIGVRWACFEKSTPLLPFLQAGRPTSTYIIPVCVRYFVAAAQINDAALEGTLFPVGDNLTFVAAATGELVCFANDAEGLYGNNRASLNVTVTRESWPPDDAVEAAYAAYVADAPTVYP